jgi:hypothetical protein
MSLTPNISIKLSVPQVIEIFNNVGPYSIYSRSIHRLHLAKELVDKGLATVLEAEWGRNTDQFQFHTTSPNLSTQTSYEQGVSCEFTAKDNRLLLELTIWNCDNYNGYATTKQCHYVIQILDINHPQLQSMVETLIEDIADERIKAQEEELKRRQKELVMTHIVNEVKDIK